MSVLWYAGELSKAYPASRPMSADTPQPLYDKHNLSQLLTMYLKYCIELL